MSLLSEIPRLVSAGIENPDETRYLEAHDQIIFGFPNATSSSVIVVGGRDLFFGKVGDTYKLVDISTGDEVFLTDAKEKRVLFSPKDLPHYLGLNFFTNKKTDVYELIGNELVYREKLPLVTFQKRLVDEKKGLFVFSPKAGEKEGIILVTFPFKIVQRFVGDSVEVVSPSAILVFKEGKEDEPKKASLYVSRNGTWERTQTFSSYGHDRLSHGILISWDDASHTKGKIMKWNSSAKTLDTVREGDLNITLGAEMLSSHLLFDNEEIPAEGEKNSTPVIRNVISGAEVQRFPIEDYEDVSIIPPNPVEYLVLTDVIQSFIPCKRSVCVIPKEVTGVIARFL
jgi:hypothetical protein